MRRQHRLWKRLRKHRLIATSLIAAIVATSMYAYTTSISGVNSGPVGSGSGAIGKYSLSGVNYNLNNNGPANNILSISFTLSGSSSSTTVRVRSTNSTTWYSCSSASAPSISCATTNPQLTATGANGGQLLIVANG